MFPIVQDPVGALGGTPGAIGFNASPSEPVVALRDVLRQATLSVYPQAPIKGADLTPHVTVAYCNSGAPATPMIRLVERLQDLPSVEVTVTRTSLVLLEVQHRAYTWTPVAQVTLS
jgi:2'-5' RNA ligase